MRNKMSRWIDQIGRMDKVVGPGYEYAVMAFIKTAGLLEFMQKLVVWWSGIRFILLDKLSML